MRLLCVHAHFDDFEFVAGGTFELFRRRLAADGRARIIVCSDGQAGHHALSRADTGRVRLGEQLKSAQLGGYEFELLRLPNGQAPREACLEVTPSFLAALWKSLRDFQPDYLFCPPVAADPLMGIHIDHIAVAEAIRQVAYMINVPHAFTLEFPEAEEHPAQPRKIPVILNVFDAYMAENACDLVVDVEEAFEHVAQMTFCHQSQIAQWLPWVGRHNMEPPKSFDDWKTALRQRCVRRNRQLGIDSERAFEFFTVTAWGDVPDYEQILRDFPNLDRTHSKLDQLKARLEKWKQ